MRRRHALVPLRVAARNAAMSDGATVVTDGDMEAAGTAAWTAGGVGCVLSKELDPRPNSTGVKCLCMTSGAGAAGNVSQSTLIKGRLYHATGWMKGNAASTSYGLRDGAGHIMQPMTTAWEYFSKYFFSQANSFSFVAPAAGWVRVDDLVISEVATDTISGLTTTANCRAFVPREDLMIGSHVANAFRLGTLGRGVRVHPAATNLMTYSDLALFGTLTALTISRYWERNLHRLLEAVANSEHKAVRTGVATLAASTPYTLSFYGRAVGARQVKVQVKTAAAVDFEETFDLTAENASYSYTFTTGAGDAGLADVTFYLVKGGVSSYVGEVACGMVLGGIVQLEAGSFATPHVYTYNATASSIAPVYDALGVASWLADRLRSPRFDFELRFSAPAGAMVATGIYPVWSLDWGATASYCDLSIVVGGEVIGIFLNASQIVGTDTWSPEADHVYRFKLTVDAAVGGVSHARLVVVDETDDAVDLDVSFDAANWTAPSTAATAVLLGCSAAGAGQWNLNLVEAEAA